MGSNQISICKNEDSVYLKVPGDEMRFYDVISVRRRHPELSHYLLVHGIEIEKALSEKREIYSAYSMV